MTDSPAGTPVPDRLTPALAAGFARIALGHVTREYPNKLDHVLAGPGDAQGPRALHPAFFGSFDWHSCVHSHWMLARLLRLFPDSEAAADTRALFDAVLTPENLLAERDYLRRPAARGFERPYGWGWLLRLAAELEGLEDGRWAAAMRPLAEAFAERFREFLPRAAYPVRSGAHYNTALALLLAADWAEARDPALLAMLRDAARGWYGADADCPAWGEPGGDDFLSPTLVEAACMRRLLPAAEFPAWLARFLPHIARGMPETLFRPATVTDRTDGKIAHLDGLNLSRAWCWRVISRDWQRDDPRRVAVDGAVGGTVAAHLAASLPHLDTHYMGEHWLATYAVLALDF